MLRLQEQAVEWALRHIETLGDTDILPVPFEFRAIRHCWDSELKPWLLRQDMLVWHERPQPYRRCLSPKHRYGFRVSTQLDPLDAIVYTALVYEIGVDLETARMPTSSAVVFSHRFAPDASGRMYDSASSYETFQQHSQNLADSGSFEYVVVADIADFFPRLYLHRLENALAVATASRDHVAALRHLLKKWNFSVSYGIPVGSAASRLLAEVAIDDVDRSLASEGYTHCRWSDDFRVFCKGEREAHQALAFLANTLFENHGLTLQQHKTEIVPVDRFVARFLQSEHRAERASLTTRFREILSDLGLSDPYEELNYDDLDGEIQQKIDALNLNGILEEQLGRQGEIDQLVCKFVLRRLSQLGDAKGVNLVLSSLERTYPIFKDALQYLSSLRSLKSSQRKRIADRLIGAMDGSILGHLEYHQCWVFNLFTENQEWDHQDRFAALYNEFGSEFARRELTLAIGRSGHSHWFRSRKRNVLQLAPWERRAFLAAASCLPKDEYDHWYRSIKRQLDELDRAVVDWAKANPFS